MIFSVLHEVHQSTLKFTEVQRSTSKYIGQNVAD